MPYRKGDFNKTLCDSLIAKYGCVAFAANAIVSECIDPRGRRPTAHAVRLWITAGRDGNNPASRVPLLVQSDAETAAANKFIKLLHDGGIDPQLVADGSITLETGNFKTWGVFAKIKDPVTKKTTIETKSLYSVGVKLSPINPDPKWPVVQKAAPVLIKYAPPQARTDGIETVVFLADMHNGFLRPIGDESRLVAIHDPAAIDVAEQIVADLQPHRLFYIGDDGDFAEHGDYVQHPEFARTTQATLNLCRSTYARFEAAAGPRVVRRGGRTIVRRKRTIAHGGNHCNRLQRMLLKNAIASYGLRRADKPNGWPAMSYPEMVGLDSLDIEYVGEKLGAEHYLTDDLRVVHEPTAGKTQDPVNEVHGHLHRFSRTSRTVYARLGPQVFTTYGIACLASLDRYPDESSLLATKLPANSQRNRCEQGIGVCYIFKDGQHYIEQVPIVQGRALFRGKLYVARKDAQAKVA